MVTVEVELKEGDEEPEQHLDDGEHIERVVVPISELYEKLQGKQNTNHQPPPCPPVKSERTPCAPQEEMVT
jgi:hypothetical protein